MTRPDPVRLIDCPPGLFWFGKTLGFRSEYSSETLANPAQPDAYVVSSGEYFWGGAKTSEARSELMVTPIDDADADLLKMRTALDAIARVIKAEVDRPGDNEDRFRTLTLALKIAEDAS